MYENLSLEELLNHTHDHAAWYWIGMAYWERYDFSNAAVWLGKTMSDPSNEWAGKAKLNLGLAHAGGYLPNSSKDEALRLFEEILEKMPNAISTKLHAGFLYCEGTETKRDTVKGGKLIKEAIQQFKDRDGGKDDYLSQIECYKVGVMYEAEGIRDKSIEYYRKAIKRANENYPSDRNLIEKAKEAIRELGG
ncbi:MAG: hypothetical protein FWC39_01255 [Bacteroidetes bacterium]|nr:hypothetical protein [Bacteroidota bacterium]